MISAFAFDLKVCSARGNVYDSEVISLLVQTLDTIFLFKNVKSLRAW